ncbi:hypothetical protein CCR83_14455 [Rhodobacter veldkampii DSM 11550]|uniref:YdbS-like PH domain-containing protein n=1 Tax=Phaeovulum veldkampii DSM 11550 TaxID=1185920 RepID=A0A2T4JIN6_9RHOB|nr:photosynthetic complex putative assembly protein PuhB [Phaeovulum veldkampii]MBK5947617.1 hypothetical protein [Phaeovulum veldkampii DSM 11550]NCU20277.1 PH domain-containing protein [Candidatus Falkowbacteria bacterium]PTE17732.1 hypothetical protein C5F46_07740 [Phaeovulum veldkampii DSM 11550]TDQ58200.1 PH (Pleckstrin Homology) domain-containing protein [Phaeovulum veldkampii DSM 11550]
MSDHDDFAFEPMPGLPARPPAGETLLWQGRPSTWALAREAFLLNWLAGYFALVVLWRGWAAWSAAEPDKAVSAVMSTGLLYLILGLLGSAIIVGLAWAQARATVYTITSARVVMRIGAALSVTLNLPYAQLESAGLDLRSGGTGTIALKLKGNTRLAYMAIWPHVRPWHMRQPEPALRCIPDAANVAQILTSAAESRISKPVVTLKMPEQGAGAAPQLAE